MRRTLFIFLLVLGGVFYLLSAIDQSDYKVERDLWFLEKEIYRISVDPKVVPQKRFDDIVLRLDGILEKYPQTKQKVPIMFQMARVCELKADREKARGIYQEMISQYADNVDIQTMARFHFAQTLEAEGKESEAFEIYRRLKDEFPLTVVGLNIPIYITNYYLRKNDGEKAQGAIEEAIREYKKIISEAENPRQKLYVKRLLINVFSAKNDWSEAIQTLGEILLESPQTGSLSQREVNEVIRSINTLAAAHMESFELPISIYQKFIDRYPEHVYNKLLLELIHGLREIHPETEKVQ